jgi:UPF0755 protein
VSNTPGGWRRDEQVGQLPPEYEPVHHKPRRRPDPRNTRPWPEAQANPAPWQPDAQGNPYPGEQPYPQEQRPGYPQPPGYPQQNQYPPQQQYPPQGQYPPQPGYPPQPPHPAHPAQPGYPAGYPRSDGYPSQPQYNQQPQYPSQPQPQLQPQWQPGTPQHARYDAPGDPRGFMPGFTNDGDGHDGQQQQGNDWVEPGQHGYAGQFQGEPQGYDQQSYEQQGYEQQGYDQQGYDQQGYEEQEYEPAQERRRKRGPVRRLAPWIALLVILIPLGIGGGFVYHLYQTKYHPADFSGPGTGRVQVHVNQGDDATSLGPVLVNLGVVASSRAFVLAAEHSSSTKGLIPGYYLMHKHMQAALAYAMLLNPANVIQTTITIPEGFRASQVIARLAFKDKHITQAEFQQALKNPALGLPPYAKGNPEGYLYPDTYPVPPNATALSVLQLMVQSFTNEATAVSLESASASTPGHLSPAQVIVVASLLQAEGGRVSDYPKIARVIYNRLAQGMKLQLDSTVLYGLNSYGILASTKQLQSTSPYNTYKYPGLPPGPIDNPGNDAIQAALHPAAGNWIYFVTTDPATGYTQFTNSYTQFLQFQQELRHNTGH